MEAIVAAIISAIVATFGVIISNRSLRLNTFSKNIELDLKIKELGTATQKLSNELEAIRQSQFSVTIQKRAEFYPLLWSSIRQHTTNWPDNKPRDLLWVKDFLDSLNQVDAKGGVFFSQGVYEKFHALKLFLFQLKEELSNAESKNANIQALEHIDTIFRGQDKEPGLAAFLKDDLGGYRNLSIQARSFWSGSKYKSASESYEQYQALKSTINNVFYKSDTCPPIISHKDLKRLKSLSRELDISESDLLTQPIGLIAVQSIPTNNPEFKKILETLQLYFAEEYLDEDDPGYQNGMIDANTALFTGGIADDFTIKGLIEFAETNYQVNLADLKLNPMRFDTILEFAAIVFTRMSMK